jgi:hypothetical protein
MRTFQHGTGYVLITTKNGWATFLATFSKTHQVTLSNVSMTLG